MLLEILAVTEPEIAAHSGTDDRGLRFMAALDGVGVGCGLELGALGRIECDEGSDVGLLDEVAELWTATLTPPVTRAPVKAKVPAIQAARSVVDVDFHQWLIPMTPLSPTFIFSCAE